MLAEGVPESQLDELRRIFDMCDPNEDLSQCMGIYKGAAQVYACSCTHSAFDMCQSVSQSFDHRGLVCASMFL